MSKKQAVCVGIPVYKLTISAAETASLQQVLVVLKKYDIVLIAPRTLDLGAYNNIFRICGRETAAVKYFDEDFFKSISGYNRLMLSGQFYKQFADFKYLLIYQLDCWIFKDDLLGWCNKGYDYIGAPWINNYWSDFYAGHLTFSRSLLYKLGCRKFNQVGNGGFSLRKINSFIFNLNLFRKAAASFTHNEDYFFAFFINSFNPFFKIPGRKKALQFAFDENAETAFTMNNNKLPMGCHGWTKNCPFWRKYIEPLKQEA